MVDSNLFVSRIRHKASSGSNSSMVDSNKEACM